MIIAIAALMTIGVLVFILAVRPSDVPETEPPSPFQHLDERKASIYENLRDLQFEYRVGKLSDQDYQQTKTDLQKELAGVLAEIDRVKQTLGERPSIAPAAAKSAPAKTAPVGNTCPHCGAVFPTALKFCGECGKPMKAAGQK